MKVLVMSWAGRWTGGALSGCARLMVSVFLAGLVAMLSACQKPPLPPLVVGMNPWVGYDALVLARERQIFDHHVVKVIEMNASSDTIRQFRNGLLDAAALTLDEAMQLADQGLDLRIIAVLDESAGADVVMASPQIRSASDLRGHAIAVESSTVGSVLLSRLLQKAGLSSGEVTVVNLVAVQHLAALRSGKAMVSVTYEPLARTLHDEGYRPIFDSREIPGEIVDVLVVRADVLRTHPAGVSALLDGWLKASLLLERDPIAAARILAPGVDLSVAEYLQVRDGLKFFDGPQSLRLMVTQPPLLAQKAERLQAQLLSMQIIQAPPKWGTMLETEPLRKLLSENPP